MFICTTWLLEGLFLKLARSAAATEQFSTAALEVQIFIAENDVQFSKCKALFANVRNPPGCGCIFYEFIGPVKWLIAHPMPMRIQKQPKGNKHPSALIF